MKYLVGIFTLFVFIVASIGIYGYKKYTISDMNLRSYIVKLHDDRGSCTGVEVKTNSGHLYILTASHCRSLVSTGSVLTEAEDKSVDAVHFIAEDPISDLMLLSPRSDQKNGIKIADFDYTHEHVHTLTRGGGMPTYRTDGELLSIDSVSFPLNFIMTDEDKKACQQPKNSIGKLDLGIFTIDTLVCFMNVKEQFSNTLIVPGSSGGALLDDNGKLIGIASASGNDFYAFVLLSDIKNFLSNK